MIKADDPKTESKWKNAGNTSASAQVFLKFCRSPGRPLCFCSARNGASALITAATLCPVFGERHHSTSPEVSGSLGLFLIS